MKKVVTKIKLFVLFTLLGKKKPKKKVEIRLKWNSISDMDLMERVRNYKIMIENMSDSPYSALPQPSITELNNHIADFYEAFYDYQFERTRESLFKLQDMREKMKSLLQFLKYQLNALNSTR